MQCLKLGLDTYKVSVAIWYEVVHKNLAVHNVYTWVKGRLRTGPMVYTTVMQSAVADTFCGLNLHKLPICVTSRFESMDM